MVTFRRKSQQRTEAIALVEKRASDLAVKHLERLSAINAPPTSDTPMEGDLDPSAGKLDEERSERKRQQIRSLAAHALTTISPGDHIVEFGAGQGHLGLLLAHLRPDCSVTLVEIKAHACEGARARVATLSLLNCAVYEGSVEAFALREEHFDCAVGLHLCGLLTDSVLELAMARRSSVCLVPCCYGQIFGTEDHQRGGTMSPCMCAS